MSYYKIGGSLKYNHPTYVVRKADEELFNYLETGEYCFVLNSRQMGKSSLRIKIGKKLQAAGIKCANIDLTLIGSNSSQNAWYKGIASQFLSSFELEKIDLNSWWENQTTLTEVQCLNKLIETILLEEFNHKIVIFLDEIDTLLKIPFKDDFFAFIRACYNQRAEKPKYNRLSFCLLGVATPADLIQDKQRTPFNIGHSIQLTGFTLEEAKKALLPGLENHVKEPENILKQILYWTGGQPFLTQKVCSIIVEKASNESLDVDKAIHQYIIANWENQDEPEHLRTIRDRLLNNEQKALRLLGLYQQVITGEIKADGSNEQTELRLSGLVVKKDNYLQVYNPIYAAIFNQQWIENQLAKIRPYTAQLNAWLNSNRHQEQLLQGELLLTAQNWAAGKSLSDIDYEYLAASQENHLQQILATAETKAKKTIRKGGIILGITFFVAIVITIATGIYSQQQLKNAQTAIKLEQAGANALQQYETGEIEGLKAAMKAGKELQKLGKPADSLEEYPAITPITALLNILGNIRQQNQLPVTGAKTVSYSPNGEIIATGGEDGNIILWSLTGEKIKTLPGHHSKVWSLTFSPDGEIIATGGEDGNIILWSLTGEKIKTLPGENTIYSLSFSGDGQKIAAGTRKGDVILWSREGKMLKTIPSHQGAVYSVSFSPDGKAIAFGGLDGTIKLQIPDGKNLLSFDAHQSEVNSISFSPDGEIIASGGEEGNVKLWRRDGTLIRSIAAHQGAITSIKFSPDGEIIASGSQDKTVKLWSPNGTLITTITTKNGLSSLSFSPSGEKIVTAEENGTVKIWKWQGGGLTTLDGISVNSVNFSPDGAIIATGEIDGSVKLWHKNGILHRSLRSHEDAVNSVSFSTDGKIIASGSDDGTVKLWSKEGKLMITLPVPEGWVRSVSFSPDSKLIAAGTNGGDVLLWKIDGSLVNTLSTEGGKVLSVAFSPDGEIIAAGRENGNVILFAKDGSVVNTLTSHQGRVLSVTFSPDGETIATGGADQKVKMWRKDGSLISTLTEQNGEVNSVKFSPEGEIIAAATASGDVNLWNKQGKLITKLTGHKFSVNSVDFSSQGNLIATGGTDGNVILWNLELEELLERGATWLQEYLIVNP